MRTGAVAYISGGRYYPEIRGVITFTRMGRGSWVIADVSGLPRFSRDGAEIGPHGFHVHECGNCVGDFIYTGKVYDPYSQPHANKAGVFPPLFSNCGVAKLEFYTDKFIPTQIVGMGAVICESADDFSGDTENNSRKIACGLIERE